MPFVILPTNSASGGYDITNSLRFNAGSSDYLNRTPASAGNRQKFTLSLWVKRSKLSTGQHILMIDTGATANFLYFASGSDQLVWYCYSSSGGVTDFYLQPNQVFRDVSAWYHIMLVVDTTIIPSLIYVLPNFSQYTEYTPLDILLRYSIIVLIT